jgi:malto-oligosyltrehalose synthase
MTAPPRATYRLQLRGGMDFAGAAGIAPYLARLGISHLYLSPPFAAAPGSTHGYDVVDPNRLDPALGGEEGFARLRRELDAHGLGLIVDIVPNHMGIGRSNAWWWDVLRHGRDSRYAGYFAIDFAADPGGKLVLPVLGGTLEEVLERGELRLVSEDGDEFLAYFDERFPLAPGGAPARDLRTTLDAQHYRLVGWREGAARRNYRRFFNIDQLAALRVEDEPVFEASHRLILDLAARGQIQGLRIDHVDGLSDPKAYLDRLQRRLAEVRADPEPFYLLVEKILIDDETLPDAWPVAGTTGYEFLNEVLRLQVARPGLEALARIAERFTGERLDLPAIVQRAKSEVLTRLFPGELWALARQLAELCGLEHEPAADALRRLVAGFPVYRTYVAGEGWSPGDVGVLEEAFDRAGADADDGARAALARIERRLAAQDEAATRLLQTLQRLSGPVMAKAVEDTAFYRYHRLLALNEVGGEADSMGAGPEAFHRKAAWRLEHRPGSMLATATHDTKRGEDARARLAVLSELPGEWERAVTHWHALNAALPRIHPADAYAFYQSLVGAWPPALRADDAAGLATLAERLEGWLVKSLREGKERSDWNDPDADYEERARAFARTSLAPRSAFAAAVAAFVLEIEVPATANSLGQLLLKLTGPGIPDIYQGTEDWDGSLVDPDNRRPVDFAARARALAEATETGTLSKLTVMSHALRLRAEQPDLFARGRYYPLAVEGPRAAHVLAFGRVDGERVAITLVTRLVAALPAQAWADTTIRLPRAWQGLPWRDRLTGLGVEIRDGHLPLAPLLQRAPVALLATV